MNQSGYWDRVNRVELILALITSVLAASSCRRGVSEGFKEGQLAYRAGDYAAALKYWRPLAEKGVAHIQHHVARLYQAGQGVTPDLGVAMQWYRRAAEQGYRPAQHDLGNLYLSLDDYPNALTRLRAAADQGDADSQFQIGVIYQYGFGVQSDRQEALRWYMKAAEGGHYNAQWHVGARNASGDGLPKDFVQAYKWFNLAAACGRIEAPAHDRDVLEKQMTPEQVTVAQRDGAAWAQKHPNYCTQ